MVLIILENNLKINHELNLEINDWKLSSNVYNIRLLIFDILYVFLLVATSSIGKELTFKFEYGV